MSRIPNSTNPFSDEPPPINPYAAPAPIAQSSSVADVRDRLRVPAIFLIVMSVLTIGVYSLSLPLSLRGGFREGADGRTEINYGFVAGQFLPVLCNAIILLGGVEMLRMRSHRAAMIAAIVACLPLCTSCIVLGIPFGIWALVLLRQPATVAAFATVAQRQR